MEKFASQMTAQLKEERAMLKGRKPSFFILAVLMIAFAGCITVQMPQYVKDKNPYKKEFYANYDKTLIATIDALQKSGWKITKEENPVVFESDSVVGPKEPRQILIFTNMRSTPMLLWSWDMTINVLVKENNEKTDVEIRYFSIFSTALWKHESYENDGLVEKILNQIDKNVNKEKVGDLQPTKSKPASLKK